MPGSNLSAAAADKAAYRRSNPTWYEQRYYGPPAPEEFALRTRRWTVMALAETREQFYTRMGVELRPTKKKRGPTREVLALREEIASLRARLAEWEGVAAMAAQEVAA